MIIIVIITLLLYDYDYIIIIQRGSEGGEGDEGGGGGCPDSLLFGWIDWMNEMLCFISFDALIIIWMSNFDLMMYDCDLAVCNALLLLILILRESLCVLFSLFRFRVGVW